jgi:hypothetical protein
MTADRRDDGLVLPIVLVIVVVLGAVIAAVATYATTTLRYGQIVEQSADRLAAANGALDNALEALDREASLCALTTLANGGYEYDLLAPTAAVSSINGINPRIGCRTVGGTVTGVEEFAVVITGDSGTGQRSGALLTIDGSSTPRKLIDGPVFMDRPPEEPSTIDLRAAATVQNGDLWYRRSTCPGTVSVPLFPAGPHDLLITPAGYGIRCITAPSWMSLFQAARPSENAVAGLPLSPAPDTTSVVGCTVWSPGRYTAPPALGAYNYFRSGTYHFDGMGNWSISNAYALFGWPGPTGPSIPGKGKTSGPPDTLADNPCVGAWENDPDRGGATLYLGGDTRITIGANGALEISGRDQGGQLVALHALETTAAPSIVHGDAPIGGTAGSRRLVRVDSGGNKQIALRGLLWAPYGSVQLDNVSNEAVAALTGGAVVGELFLQAPASATNLVVGRGSTPADRRLEFTATATSADGGTTQVRAIVTYRDGEYALESRRVMCTTPDDPDAAAC